MNITNIKNKLGGRLRDKLGRFKSIKVDLLDGQKRGEVIFRRVVVVAIAIAVIYFILSLVVGVKPEVPECPHKTGDIIDGQEIEVRGDCEVWYIVPDEMIDEELKQPKKFVPEVEEVKEEIKEEKDVVSEYIKNYGGRITPEYLTTLRRYCDEDSLKLVVAVSVAETGMGKRTNKQTNFWGFFWNGNRQYDPSQEEMAQRICNSMSGYYSDIAYNEYKASRYTGGDATKTWMGNVQTVLLALQGGK